MIIKLLTLLRSKTEIRTYEGRSLRTARGTYTESGKTYTITKVEMRGGQAKGALNNLDWEVNSTQNIILESQVDFWVNSSVTDFTKYLIRPRIK